MRLYFHIPFCRQRCGYCKFALVPYVQEARIRRYLGFLLAEVDAFFPTLPESGRAPIKSVYFGGGTPSTFSLADLASVLDRVRFHVPLAPDCEITLEANPEDVTGEYLRGLAGLGVTRLSLGVQTLSDKTLRFIGRSGRDHVLRAFDAFGAADTGMALATDFIAGLPGTDVGTVARDIVETLGRVRVDHASVYMLEAGKYPPGYDFPEEDIPSAYFLAADALRERGFDRYEVSNFALPGKRCAHNTGYWRHEDYRGFGLSAASYVGGVRRENSASFAGYERGEFGMEILTAEQLRLERLMFGLRTDGADRADVWDSAALGRLLAEGTVTELE